MASYLRTLDGKEVAVGAKPVIECFRCGICCIEYQAPVEDEDIGSLARGLGIRTADVVSAYLQDTPMGYLIRRNEKGCVFLETGAESGLAACRVHAFRPDACRTWQASLDKPECRKGLSRMRACGGLVMPDQLYGSEEAAREFGPQLRTE